MDSKCSGGLGLPCYACDVPASGVRTLNVNGFVAQQTFTCEYSVNPDGLDGPLPDDYDAFREGLRQLGYFPA
jgi:hypothetical protein